MTDCKCNTCKFRNDTKIINPCLDCDDFSHYCENEEIKDRTGYALSKTIKRVRFVSK